MFFIILEFVSAVILASSYSPSARFTSTPLRQACRNDTINHSRRNLLPTTASGKIHTFKDRRISFFEEKFTLKFASAEVALLGS